MSQRYEEPLEALYRARDLVHTATTDVRRSSDVPSLATYSHALTGVLDGVFTLLDELGSPDPSTTQARHLIEMQWALGTAIVTAHDEPESCLSTITQRGSGMEHHDHGRVNARPISTGHGE